MNKVFVVNEPLRWNHAKSELEHFIELKPAEAYGTLQYLLPPGREPEDIDDAMQQLDTGLSECTTDDYLLPIGSITMICAAAAKAAYYAGGQLRVLEWDRKMHCYNVVEMVVWEAEEENVG